MDLLKNPFHILGATQRDDRQRIMELEEKYSLLSDPDTCIAARAMLLNPRNRIAAEVAWLPGVNPEQIESVLNHLDSPSQNILNTIGLSSLAYVNVMTAGLSRFTNMPSTDLRNWILAISHAYERIDPEDVRNVLNEERNLSGFPQITDTSVISTEIQNQRRYYTQTLSAVLNNLSVNERARILISTLDTVIGNNNSRCPILIDDLIQSYEQSVVDDLKKKQNIIEAQIDKIRSMVDAKNPDTVLQPIVEQLIQSVKDWDKIAQPIQLSKRSRGERHTDSFEIAMCVQKLAVYLFNEYNKFDFTLQLLNMLLDVFAEDPEIVEQIERDKKTLEARIHEEKIFEEFKVVETQVENLKAAADVKKPDSILTSMVNQLIQTVKTWDTSTQPIEANAVLGFTVRNIALHLWNEHQKLDFAIQITNTLIEHFKGVNGMGELNNRLNEDKKILDKHAINARGLRRFNNIKREIKLLKEAADAYKPDYTLTSMVSQLLETVNTWTPYEQPIEANNTVALTVRDIGLHLWNKHQKLDFAIQITTAIIAKFKNVKGMEKVNDQLNQDLVTLMSIKQAQKRKGTGCLLQIAIFGILGLIGALLQGC